MLEKDLEGWLGRRLREAGCLYYKFVSPGNNGVPDRIVICPDGTVYWLELKRPSGRLAALQSAQLSRLARYVQRTAQVWSMAGARRFAERVTRWHLNRCDRREVWRADDDGEI